MSRGAKPGGPALYRLARLYGVQTSYFSGGRRVSASSESLIAVLRSLGVDIRSPEAAPAALREREGLLRKRVLEPVHVVWDGAPSAMWAQSRWPLDVRLTLESGETREWRLAAGDPLLLPLLPLGYHEVAVSARGVNARCLVVSAPSHAYWPPDAGRSWGVFLPLYGLHSREDWGVGEFPALARLAGFAAARGASFVATLPLYSTFLDSPFNPSPYAPVSRLFWNELYIRIEDVPELGACPAARDLIAAPDFQHELARLRSSPFVEYREAMALKRRVLELLASALAGSRLEAFQRFLDCNPALLDYARFRAATEGHRAPWTQWPEPAHQGLLGERDLDPSSVRYHEYVQWLADEQLAEAAAASAREGAGLFFDLPIGSSREGYDVWRNQSLYALGASVGAPGDALFVNGQDWGFPPPHPEAQRSSGYACFIAVLRRALTYAAALRIDHVMGFDRLFWIPHGLSPAQGVYVRYRPDEAYAILCLESQRNRAVLVGEDLGTVPPQTESALARHNICGMYVMEFNVFPGEAGAVRRPPERSLALLGTHDMPPFAAWLDGSDISRSRDLGFISRETEERLHAERGSQRAALARFLQGRGLVPANPDTADLVRGALRLLAGSRARMLQANLEDLWLETEPQNLPGTSGDLYPSWRRKAARSLEEMELDAAITVSLEEIRAARGAGSRA